LTWRDVEALEGKKLSELSVFELEVAKLIVEALHLEVAPGDISPTGPLFDAQAHDGPELETSGSATQQRALGLDSIDALEIALAISQRYGFQLKSDDQRNHRIFASLRSLAAHIERHRTK
jgi:acyl carrier protein